MSALDQLLDPAYYEELGEARVEDRQDDLGRAELELKYAEHKFREMKDVMLMMYVYLYGLAKAGRIDPEGAIVSFKRDLVCLGVIDLEEE